MRGGYMFVELTDDAFDGTVGDDLADRLDHAITVQKPVVFMINTERIIGVCSTTYGASCDGFIAGFSPIETLGSLVLHVTRSASGQWSIELQ